MFNNTFFKFLITFVALIVISFLIMSFTTDMGIKDQDNSGPGDQKSINK